MNKIIFWVCLFSLAIDAALCVFTDKQPLWIGTLSMDVLAAMAYAQLGYGKGK